MHTNGKGYAEQNFRENINYDEHFKQIKFKLEFISIVFLVLLILIKPSSISSTDYIDALDVGIKSEKGSQYFVALFIQGFINEHIDRFDLKLKEFLIKNTYMHIK